METASRWIRYGAGIPEVLAKCTHNKKWGPLVRMTITYYADMYLDALVAWDYYQKGYTGWAAVSGAIFAFFMVTQLWRSYRFAREHNVYLFRTSVLMVCWNVFFSSDPPHVIDTLATELLNAINEEGLFEAPVQLAFQVYVIIFQWARIGSPDIVQFASISISIISMAYASVRMFDKPYIFLGLTGGAVKSRHLAPYIAMRFFQLASRIVTLAFIGTVLEGNVFKCALVLCAMIAVRIWVFRSLLPSWEGSRKEGSILAWHNPHFHQLWVGNIPPFAVILGSLVSDAFFGDAHFYEHLKVLPPSENFSTVKVVPAGAAAAAVAAPAGTGGGDFGGEAPAGKTEDEEEQRKENIRRQAEMVKMEKIHFYETMGIESLSIRRGDDGPSSSSETDDTPLIIYGIGLIECCGCCLSYHMRRIVETIRRKEAEQEEHTHLTEASNARRLLIVDDAEVVREVVRVTRGTLLIAAENFLCFLAASANADQFDFDPTLIGRMALGVGGCMLLQGLLFWRLYYAPLDRLPQPASRTVTSMFLSYGLLVVAIMITAAVTGIGTSKCPEEGCGTPDSYCIPLSGAYECRCGGGAVKKPGATLTDICYAPCPATGSCGDLAAGACLRQPGTSTYDCRCEQGGTLSGTPVLCHDPCPEAGCGFAGQCVPLTDTAYECECEKGVSAKQPGATLSDVCHDPCPEEGCGFEGQCVALTDTTYECVCGEGVSAKKPGATLSDKCHDPCREGACGVAGTCKWLTDTTYGCECEVGRSAKRPGATPSDICYDPCPEDEGCGFAGQCVALTDTAYECVCEEERSAKKPGATLSDICHDPCPEEGCGFAGQCVALTDTAYECVCEEERSAKKPRAPLSDICQAPCPATGCGHAGECLRLEGSTYECGCEQGGTVSGTLCHDPCPEGGCGFEGQCVALTDTTYECVCEQGISAKKPGVPLSDVCHDPCREGACGVAGTCKWLTGGTTYGCECEVGRSAKRPGATPSDICYDPCPEEGCGFAGQCVALTDTAYECVCEDGRSAKKPGAPLSDICHVCREGACGVAGTCKWLTGGTTYECVCEDGRSAKRPGAAPSDICSDPCPEEGCGFAGQCVALTDTTYECICEEGRSAKKPGAPLSDICHDPCPEEGCGFAGQCVALTDTAYECVCEDGRSAKKPGAPLSDICHDPCREGACGVAGTCKWLTDTTYECECEVGRSAKRPGAAPSDICSDPCPEEGCGVAGQCVALTNIAYECVCEEERSAKKPGASLSDICQAPVCLLDNGGCGNHHCWSRDGGVSCTDMFCSPGELASQTKISSSSSDLLQDLLSDRDYFGASIAWLGDVDGDGVNDVAVGARQDDEGRRDSGAVYILLLTDEGSVKEVAHKIKSSTPQDSDEFGIAVAVIGDLDGDGVNEMVVGASRAHSSAGALYVLFLQSDGSVKAEQEISANQGGLVGPLQVGDLFGAAVAAIGDLDGDGVGEIAVGAWGDDDRGSRGGAVYVLFLHIDGMVRGEQKLTTAGTDVTQFFGCAVAGLGDLNGDGVPDIAVGAYGDDDGGTNRGAVFVLLLSQSGIATQVQKISESQGGFVGALEDHYHFGRSLAALGDLDGDGVVDLAVGASGMRSEYAVFGTGGAYVLLLREDGTVKSEAKISSKQSEGGAVIDGLVRYDRLGTSMSAVRDVNGERGMVGLAVGSRAAGEKNRGAVYIIRVPPGFAGMCHDEDAGGVCVNTPDLGYTCEE